MYDEEGPLQLRFAGGHSDPLTGLVRFSARDYDPEIGRWTTSDPIGIQGGLNTYIYVGNNPINLTDSLGLAPGWLDGAELGLAVAGMAPGVGIFADGLSLVIRIGRGDFEGAVIDGGAMTPGFGQGVCGAQLT